MTEKFKDTTPPQESLEDLRHQLKRAEEEHAGLLQASQNEPKSSELRVETDKAFDKLSRIKTSIEKITGKEEE